MNMDKVREASKEEAIESKFEKAKELKLKGNEFFKSQNFKKALYQYHSALMYLKGVECDINPSVPFGETLKLSAEKEDNINVLNAEIQNNLAACFLKQNPIKYNRILECCKEAIKRQPDNLKATYRMALAYYHLKDYDKARDSILEANRIASGEVST
ncbi:Tetratricopeptide repeat protein 9C [Armadillidium nasatum]|uniref:peptidylprolyl isomerase n=1 Tax=Armadillidium nasatum TaxID=96803 RepID=A0A5N5SYU3_9CRUS|nr:Tetratricopeptide repeat protein 9C [Armadillidium nasatum]